MVFVVKQFAAKSSCIFDLAAGRIGTIFVFWIDVVLLSGNICQLIKVDVII